MSSPVDLRQVCPECNSKLTWEQVNEPGEEPAYNGRCSCSWEVFDCPKPELPHLTPLEEHIMAQLARLAELEEALRWRVTADELPPVGEWVLGYYGGSEPYEIVRYDGDQWDFSSLKDVNEPEHWQPIRKPGAS